MFRLAILLALCAAARAQDAAPRPHVVVLLADDLGWNDVGFHGGQVKTPHLDRLAASGARLAQFYVQPVCSPTRSSLMTGRYPIRQGLQKGVIRPWAQYGLPLEERTLAQALKAAGYRTAITGKWHLGLHAPAYLPSRRGFDHQYGHYCGALDYFTHRRGRGLDWHRNGKALREEGYATNLIAREAVRLVEQHDRMQPLFLYVPFNAVHTPLQAPKEYLERFADVPREKRRKYLAMLACMDDAVGAILAALDKRQMRKNTLVFFCSDNGGAQAASDNRPLRGRKGTLYEGGVRVPAVVSWPGRLAPGSVVKAPLHIVDLYPTLVKLAGGSLEQPLPLDGKDAWPALAQGKPTPHEEILHNLEPNRAALRRGDFKLVVKGPRLWEKERKAAMKTELFDIATDPNEETDLAQENPEMVQELMARLRRYAAEAVPPKNKPRAKDFKVPKVWGEG